LGWNNPLSSLVSKNIKSHFVCKNLTLRVETNLVRVEIALYVYKLHFSCKSHTLVCRKCQNYTLVCGNHTLLVKINLVRVEVTLLRVGITFERVEITLVSVMFTHIRVKSTLVYIESILCVWKPILSVL
jgi:hypothetical protein